MITVTPSAAEQIRLSADQSSMQGVPLRVAATRLQNGSLHYAIGFDDRHHDGDKTFQSEGIEIVVAPPSMELLSGTVIDYVDVEGKKEIIFINPNDPDQKKPG
jgi:iron-sulfur cluster assembly protein